VARGALEPADAAAEPHRDQEPAEEGDHEGAGGGDQHALANERDGGLNVLEADRVERDARAPSRALDPLRDHPDLLVAEGAVGALDVMRLDRAAGHRLVEGHHLARPVDGVEARVLLPRALALPVLHGHARVGRVLGDADAVGVVPRRELPAAERQLQRRPGGLRLLHEVVEPAPLEVLLELRNHDEPDDHERGRGDQEEDEGELVAERA